MTCEQFADCVADLVDERLEPAAAAEATRHADTCDACRALVADLRTIRAAAFTLDRLEPPARVWTRIEERRGQEPAARAPRRLAVWPPAPQAWRVWGAAAAALVVATLVGVWSLAPAGPSEQAGDTSAGDQQLVASVESDLLAAEAHYDKAIQGLEQIARTGSSALDPQVATVLQKNLQVIDRAIGESRAALQAQPTSTDVQDGLFDAMRAKVALLQQTVELINEMRKGNPAEAGRIIEGLK